MSLGRQCDHLKQWAMRYSLVGSSNFWIPILWPQIGTRILFRPEFRKFWLESHKKIPLSGKSLESEFRYDNRNSSFLYQGIPYISCSTYSSLYVKPMQSVCTIIKPKQQHTQPPHIVPPSCTHPPLIIFFAPSIVVANHFVGEISPFAEDITEDRHTQISQNKARSWGRDCCPIPIPIPIPISGN